MLVQQQSPAILSPHFLNELKTPALVFDKTRLKRLLESGMEAKDKTGIKISFAVKALAQIDVLKVLEPHLDGFSVSSLFEARFIRNHFPGTAIHFTSPGIRPDEVPELVSLSDFATLNSRTQFYKHGAAFSKNSSLGIRVNTRISHVPDQRYDPCRPGSKLGIPIEEIPEFLDSVPNAVEGLHIHTNSDSTDFCELLNNVEVLLGAIPKGQSLKWVNLGGGYLLEDTSLEPLARAAHLIRHRFGAEVFVEPGAGLVRSAGFLVGSVLDIFEVDKAQVAILDTTVNHMPEILEFDYQPDVVGQSQDGEFEFTLAGATCLAGDIFGTYRFSSPLEVGNKVIVEEAGAYTISKAHRFNGVNFPEIGILTNGGHYRVTKAFSYQDFESFWNTNA